MNIELIHIYQTARHRARVQLWAKSILDKNSRSKWRRVVVDVVSFYAKFLANFVDRPINWAIYKYRTVKGNK